MESMTYIEEHREFLEYFKAHVDPTDQLPVRVPGYHLLESEIDGEVINWVLQYLFQMKCPQSLLAPIVNEVVQETRKSYMKIPKQCGFDGYAYNPLKLSTIVISHTNGVCERLLDNAELNDILAKSSASVLSQAPRHCMKAIKNTRRKMEDRHVCISDFNGMFAVKDQEPTSFYGVFDGHGGQDAAFFTAAHLCYNIAKSSKYPQNIEGAIKEAFLKTDVAFIDKSEKHALNCGTTALVCVYRAIEKRLFVGWVGDSQALLVCEGKVCQIVSPHVPSVESECTRIEQLGGVVLNWNGSYRVNGQLAVSRAIGDAPMKPYITGEPDISSITLEGKEDFLIIASDGLWESLTEDFIALFVYRMIAENSECADSIAEQLVERARKGTSDNITVVVVFFKDPHLIAKSSWLNKMEATYDKNNTNSTFDNDSAHFKLSNMDGGLNLSSDMLEGNELEEQQVISSPTITKNNYNESNHVLISDKSTDVVDHHQRFVDDFGPETDVDAMDDPNTIKSPMEQQANDSINEYNLCNGVKPFSLENKIIQQLSEQNRDFLSDSNPFKNDHFDQFSDDHLILEDTIENNHSPSEVVDNKIIDALESAVSNGDQEQYELDSEKQMETTLDASQKTSEIPDVTEKVDLMHEKTSFTLDDAFGQHSENPFNQPVNEEAALFEQACVEESVGEDTEEEEDEWNYIKADKKSEENLQRSEILDSHSSDEAELARKQSSQGSERSESVPVLAELPELNIAYDSQLPDSPLVDSVEKKDTLEEEKDEKIVGVSAPVDEISDNIVPEESYSAGYTSVEQSRIQQELADIEIGPPIATPSAVTLDPLEDIHHTPLSEDPSVEVEQNLSEEKVTEFLSEDKNIVEIATEPSVELVAKDTSSLEVLTGDTLSTDVELEQEPENVEQTIALLDNEEPVTKQIDKELQLTIESKTSADVERVRPDSLSLEMASKLNPEAKEFVPVSSPTRSNPTSPVANAPSMVPNSYLMLDDDTVVAQSPKKCSTTMDNIDVPEEDAFQHEMNNRPHELEKPSEYVNGSAEISARSHSPASEPSYQELNLKEAMQADEKLEHDYNDEKQVVPEDSPSELSNEQNILHVLNKEQDPMNMSFYEGRDEALLGNSDELNKVHVLPEEEDDEQPNEDDDKIQADDCVVSVHDGKPSDDKGEIVEPETASHTTLEEEQYDESKPTVHEEPSAPIFAVASQVVNDVAALVDQMQIETPILNAYHDLETKEDETVELENILPETEDVTMEQSNDILIRLENQSESKPLEDAVVEEHTESPHITTADYDAITHTAETDELVSPLVEFVQHEIVAENEFITDESVLNELSPPQRVFSAEAPVDYEPLVEEPAKELATPTVVDSVPTGNENSVPSIEPAATNLSDTVIPASEREVKLSEEPKLAVIAPKSATHKTTATSKSAATTKHTAMKTASKPSALTTDKKASVSAKAPSKSIPAKSSIAPKPSTAASTMKKTTTVSHASTATSSRTVGTAKPSTASSITRTSLTGTSTNKSMVTEKKAPLLAKKPVTTAVNGDVKTTIARKPLTSSTLKTTAATKITTTPSSSTSVPNARLSGTSVKSTLAKPLTATTKTSTSAPAKPSSAATRTPATALAAKPRTAPSTASKTASATSTSTMTSKTSQGSSSAVTKRVSTAVTVATTRTTTASKTATTATKASSVTSRTSTVSKLSSSSATSTVRKATAASPAKKAVSSPASKTSTKTSTSTGKTITSTKTVVSSHANDVKDPLIEDSISSDLLNLDKQLKNDNNQLITKNGIDSQMMVIDSAAD